MNEQTVECAILEDEIRSYLIRNDQFEEVKTAYTTDNFRWFNRMCKLIYNRIYHQMEFIVIEQTMCDCLENVVVNHYQLKRK